MPPSQITRISSYVLLKDDDRILLCRLSSVVSDFEGWWTLPGGGIEFGEHPADAAIREVKEETGLDVVINAIAEIDSQVFENPDREMHAVRFIFEGEVLGGELQNEADGSTDKAEWFTREQTLDMPLVEVATLGVELAFD